MKTLALLFVACALAGIAIPVPEDVVLIAAGSTLTDPVTFVGFYATAVLGLLCRDAIFFSVGHFAGEGLLRWPRLRGLLGERRITRARELVESRGGRAVLFSRFVIGFRATGFLASGALGVPFRDFLLWDCIGLLVSVPITLGIGYAFGGPISVVVDWILDHRLLVVGVVALGVLVGWLARWFAARSE